MAILKNTTIDDTSYLIPAAGPTSFRPALSVPGDMRYNTSMNVMEQYGNGKWNYMPPIVENGLVMNVDAAEPTSYNSSVQNFIRYSEQLHQQTWTFGNVSVSQNQIVSPTGSLTADLVTNNNQLISLISQTIGVSVCGTGQQTCSVYAKYHSATYFTFNCYYEGDGELNIDFNLVTGTCGAGGTIESVGDGWYRCSFVAPARVNTGSTFFNYRIWPAGRTVTNTTGCYFWGAQVQNGSSLTAYNKTTTTVKTLNTTWADLTDNGNSALLINGPTYNSQNAGNIIFDGTNDYATMTSAGFPTGASPGTISAWARASTITGSWGWIVAYGDAAGGQSRALGINGSTYYFAGYSSDISASGVPLDTWFNIVGVYTGTTALLYINGVLRAGPTTLSWNTTANNPRIGSQVTSTEYWNGRIGQIGVYNRALTIEEIRQNFNSMRRRYGI